MLDKVFKKDMNKEKVKLIIIPGLLVKHREDPIKEVVPIVYLMLAGKSKRKFASHLIEVTYL